MNILHALLAEHGMLYEFFDHMERVVCAHESLPALQATTRMVKRSLDVHSHAEEALLLPALMVGSIGPGPLPTVQREHRHQEQLVARILDAQTLPEAVSVSLTLLEDLRMHFAREEESLFTLAQRMVPEATLLDLGRQWARLRNVSLATFTLSGADPRV